VDARDTDPGGDDRQPAVVDRNGPGGSDEEPVIVERPEEPEPEAPNVDEDAENREEQEEEMAPMLRRSGRERRQPNWTVSGEFVMSSQVVRQVEQERLKILFDLAASGLVKSDDLAAYLYRSVAK
jgi:hypothetical protein